MNFDDYDDTKPRNAAQARQVAKLRILGEKQTDIVDEIDVSQPTVSRWMNADWWLDLVGDVADDFDDELVGKAKRELLDALESDEKWATRDARWLLERLGDGRYLHPKERAEKEALTSDDEPDDGTDWGEFLTVDEMKLLQSILEEFETVREADEPVEREIVGYDLHVED